MDNVKKDNVDEIVYGYNTNISHLEEENKILKQTVTHLKNELARLQRAPLLVAEVKELIGDGLIIRLPNGNEFFVITASGVSKVFPGDTVLVEQKNLTVVKKVPITKKFNVEKYVIINTPNVKWDEIGGLKKQSEEIREVIELPLKKPQLFKKVGIQPPKGILLYGPPGTGKTLLAKAVASSTNSTFIELVGSELVQKFIGEGAKLVKEVFQLAREKAPSVVFIDEIDALAAKRVDVGTSGEREVQRTFMQLLAEIDGFKHLGNVKIIGCTNRRDILDPAIIRPGRLDRLIFVPLPNKDGLTEIFRIHTAKMTLDKKIDHDKLMKLMDSFSGAEVKAVCTEAGYFAIRENKTMVNENDFTKAIKKVQELEENFKDNKDYSKMFG